MLSHIYNTASLHSRRDGSVMDVVYPFARPPNSISLPNLSQKTLGTDALSASTISSSGSFTQNSVILSELPCILKKRLVSSQQRVYTLETELDDLRHTVMMLKSDAEASEGELSEFRANYYLERFQAKVLRQRVKADMDKLQILSDKLLQAERFIGIMVDIKLHDHVLRRAARSLHKGEDAEDALIEAIKEAASKHGSPWSRIIPAVIGPRTPEHYLSAINQTIQARKDLRCSEKVAKFWKAQAMVSSVQTGSLTPSSSILSDFVDLPIEKYEQPSGMDELLENLNAGNKSRGKVSVILGDNEPSETVSTSSYIVSLPPPPETPAVDSENLLSNRMPHGSSLIDTVSSDTCLHTDHVTPARGSKTVRFAASHLPPAAARPVLRNIDVNKTPQATALRTPKGSPVLAFTPSKRSIPKVKAPSSGVTPMNVRVTPPPKCASSLSRVAFGKTLSSSPPRVASKSPSKAMTSQSLKAPPIHNPALPNSKTVSTPSKCSRVAAKVDVPARVKSRSSLTDSTVKENKIPPENPSPKARLSAKAQGKRRGFIISGDVHSITASLLAPKHSSMPLQSLTDYKEVPKARISADSFVTQGAIRNPQLLSAIMEKTTEGLNRDTPAPSISEAVLNAEPTSSLGATSDEVDVHSFPTAQALLSLERICAAFSHGSLGSLSMTEDDMPGSSSLDDKEQLEDTTTSCAVQENLSPKSSINVTCQSTFACVSSSTLASEDNDATPTRNSIAHTSQRKMSMLPLLKISRPISLSGASSKQGIRPPQAPKHPAIDPDLLMVRKPLHPVIPGLRAPSVTKSPSIEASTAKLTQSFGKQGPSPSVLPNDARISPPVVKKIPSMTSRLTQPLRIAKKPSPLKTQTPTRAPISPPSKTQAAPLATRTPHKPRTSLSRMSAIISTRIRGTSSSKVVLGSTRVLA